MNKNIAKFTRLFEKELKKLTKDPFYNADLDEKLILLNDYELSVNSKGEFTFIMNYKSEIAHYVVFEAVRKIKWYLDGNINLISLRHLTSKQKARGVGSVGDAMAFMSLYGRGAADKVLSVKTEMKFSIDNVKKIDLKNRKEPVKQKYFTNFKHFDLDDIHYENTIIPVYIGF